MTTEEFLARFNIADKGWGLWLNRNNIHEYHLGNYSFENDRLPKSFVHAGSLNDLAHYRQKYLLQKNNIKKSAELLAREWAEQFLLQWQVST